MASAPQSGQQAAGRPGIFVSLDKFWLRVTEGLEISQLWKQFHTDARASYRLYQRDFDARAPREGRRHNFWHTVQELSWAILEKLTPARRVLLLLGVLLLVLPGSGVQFEKGGHVEVIQFDLRFWGGVLLFILLLLEVADRVVMKRDLEIARDIQKWLLPATPPQVPGLALAFATRPANTVAGDYYDVFPRPGDASAEPHFLLTVADVAGKSIPAALLMATLQASLRTLSSTGCSLSELLAGMNRYACSNSQGGLRFTTAFLAEFDPAARRLAYINAGHNAPALRRASGAVERLTSGGLPLGIQAEAHYESGELTLAPGDWLLIFTDGLVEALNDRGEEYGEARMLDVLHSGAAATPEELLRRLMINVDGFVGTTPQHDDITCMVVQVG
ncbi:MAG TPA: PP2C family protein-serine/threonine phosphatase [Terriglobales bacterium]|nr:PP2C family protein-serine/threonine phosphatase [Terriglobales bacterium]